MEKIDSSRQRAGRSTVKYPILLRTVMGPPDQRPTGPPSSSITSTTLELYRTLRHRQPVQDLPPPPLTRADLPEHQRHHDHGQRDWAHLPIDALTLIFRKLGEPDVRIFAGPVCRSWWRLATHPAEPYLRLVEGRCLDMRRLPSSLWLVVDTDRLCRVAFHHTAGQIDKLYAVNVSNNLLPCIADSVGNLKLLSLIKSDNISVECLHHFLLRHCPLLEELRLYACLFDIPKTGQLGQACQHLKRFWIDGTYLSDHEIDEEPEYRRFKKSTRCYGLFRSDSSDCESDDNSDKDAHLLSRGDWLASEIANNMPQLRHLQLIRSTTLTRKGVNALLDKCLYLESLDLRCCFRLRVDRALHNRLLKIKSVRLSRCSQFHQS